MKTKSSKTHWFIAHIVMYTKFKHGPQVEFPVWENIHLIRANGPRSALYKAEKLGRRNEGDDRGSFTWGGRPSKWIFGGIRKLVSCDGFDDGAELAFLEFSINGKRSLKNLISGKEVKLTLSGMSSFQHPKQKVRKI